MILSLSSAASTQDQKQKRSKTKTNPLVLPLEGNARLDNKMYLARGKLVQSEEELSKLMADVHATLLRYCIRQSYTLVSHDQQPVQSGEQTQKDTKADAEALLTQVQARLLATGENKLHVTTSASSLQRKLAHGTYTLYLRALVATWQCIMSVANSANHAMIEIDREEFIQQVLHKPSTTDLSAKTAALLSTYHSQVQQCADKVEQLRKAAMRQLWGAHSPTAIPLDLHVNMFKNYLSQVRAWLQEQPSLALE